MRWIWLPLAATACAWISEEDRQEALSQIPFEVSVVGQPDPAALATCNLPDEVALELEFSPNLDQERMILSYRFDPLQELIVLDPFVLEANASNEVRHTAVLPLTESSCGEVCDTLEVSVRWDEPLVDSPVNSFSLPFTIGSPMPTLVRADLVNPTEVLPVDQIPLSTASPVDAINTDRFPTLRFTIDEPAWEAPYTEGLAPGLIACPAGLQPGSPACFPVSTVAIDTEGSSRRFEADLTELSEACTTGFPDLIELFVGLDGSPCALEAVALPIPAAHYVLPDCDGDNDPGLAWGGTDCDDADPGVNPAQMVDDNCDQVDTDCDGSIDEDVGPWYPDIDSDGWGATTGALPATCPAPSANHVQRSGDCDDADAFISPGAAELPCDGVDNDCNSTTADDAGGQDYFDDADDDGFGDPTTGVPTSCPNSLQVLNALDCDDTDPSQPSDWWPDVDGDGYGNPAVTPTLACFLPGSANNDADCDDAQAAVGPPRSWYPDADGDGLGADSTPQPSCLPISGRADNALDCDDGVVPGTGDPLEFQAAEGVILAGGAYNSAASFDWSTAASYTDIQVCGPLSGQVQVPEIQLDGGETLRSGTAGARVTLVATEQSIIDLSSGTATLQNIALQGTNQSSSGCIRTASGTTLNLTDARATGCVSGGEGGAIYAEGDVVLSGVELDNNGANGPGGAVHLATSDATLSATDSLFLDNSATGDGGAIDCVSSCEITLTDTDFIGNSGSAGGALHALCAQQTVRLIGTRFLDNSASGAGGAVWVQGNSGAQQSCTLDLVDARFEDNSSGGNGGHIFGRRAAVSANNSEFRRGQAVFGGAISLAGSDNSALLTRGSFIANQASDGGGALHLVNTDLSLPCAQCSLGSNQGVVFSGNSATTDGGAIYAASNTMVQATASIFTENDAGGMGGAVAFTNNGGSLFSEVLFDRNTAPDGSALTTGGNAEPGIALLTLSDVRIIRVDQPVQGASTLYINNGLGGNTELSFTGLDLVDGVLFEVDLRFESDSSSFELGTAGVCTQSSAGNTQPDCQ